MEKATARHWEELYLDAFEQALAEERSSLSRYGRIDVVLNRAALERALHYNLATSLTDRALSQLTDPQFVDALAAAMSEHRALAVGGNDLSEDDYRQLLANLVRHATASFKNAVTESQVAFQQAIIAQSLHDASLLAETQRYLAQHFDLALEALALLPAVKADTDAIRRDLAIIASTASMATRPDRAQRLGEMALFSHARCIERWQAAGLSRDQAMVLADDPAVGRLSLEYQPSPRRPLLVLVADLGAGKSLIGERLLQTAIDLAARNVEAPVPVFLEARDCIGRLMLAVLEQAENIGDAQRQGATVVVDGADEAGLGSEELLSECRILVSSWPNTTIVITSRPLPAFAPDTCKDERVDMRLLSEEESTDLIRRLSGHQQFHLSSWPAPIRDALRLPLFAILLGVHLQRSAQVVPQSTGELLAYLVVRSLGRTALNSTASDLLLQQLAVLSTDRQGGDVPTSGLATMDQVQALLDSRLVVERIGGVAFPLAILREWFAAHSLANGDPDVDALLADRKRLELWRYPLIMYVSLFDDDQVFGVLGRLAEKHPGFASAIVDEALPRRNTGGELARRPHRMGRLDSRRDARMGQRARPPLESGRSRHWRWSMRPLAVDSSAMVWLRPGIMDWKTCLKLSIPGRALTSLGRLIGVLHQYHIRSSVRYGPGDGRAIA